MVVPILPIFLAVELGASAFDVAVIDGVGVVVAALVAPFAGRWSSRVSPLKLARLGYGLSSVAKGALVFAVTPIGALEVRALDRLGKGVRDAPRDILLLASSPQRPGKAIGIQQAMDKLGGVLGPLAGLAVFTLSDSSFDSVFLIAMVPCLISVLILFVMTSDTRAPAPDPVEAKRLGHNPGRLESWTRPEMVALGLHSFGALSLSLLVLAAFQQAQSATPVLLAFALLRATTALTSIPAGLGADRFGPARLVLVGVSVWSIGLGLGFADFPHWPLVVLPLIGIGDGLVRGPSKVWITRITPAHLRGHALGQLSAIKSWASLVGGLLAGLVWGTGGHNAFAIALAAQLGAAAVICWLLLHEIRERRLVEVK